MKIYRYILTFVWLLGAFVECSTAEKIRVACIGDSITYGLGIEDRSATYPAQLQTLLGDGYEVRNFGSSGRGVIKSSKRGKGWRAYIKQDEHQQALDFNPEIAICNLGINDIMDYRAGHAAEFIPDYLELIRAYQQLPSHPKIFIWIKLAPLFPENKCCDWDTPFVLRLDLEKVAAETGAIGLDLFSGLVGRADLFQKDGIHPNAKGYQVVAQLTYDQIKPYLNGDFGGLKLPYIYGDHMVLQRGKELYFHGSANAGQRLTVKFAGKTAATVAGKNGQWEVRMPPMKAGGPYQLEIKGEKTLVFKDVMVGEVWIAAGQSNMELPLKICWGGEKEIARSDNSNLRVLDRQRTMRKGNVSFSEDELACCSPERFYKGEWEISSPESVTGFSGVAWFFAKQLQQELGVPVGIVQIAVGGAPCEAFISEPALRGNPLLLPEVADNGCWLDNPAIPEWPRGRARVQLKNWIEHPGGPMPGHPFEPSFLYRAAIAPLGQFPVRGVIWYQGESNATATDGMKAMPKDWVRAGLETLISDWRDQFQQGDLPFYFVQLPNYEKHNWMVFREMQLEVSKEVPNTGMAVTIDVGDPNNVHPKNKRPVGERLAKLALAKTYGRDVACSGPAYRTFSVEGNQLRVFFDFAEGLQPACGENVLGFEIAGKDGVFHPAQARVEGDSVLLHSADVSKPVAVRYGWAPNPECNLVNSEKLPASPFRSDPEKR